MTTTDMETIVEYYLGGISTKAVLEDTDVQVSRREVEEFMHEVLRSVTDDIRLGHVDDDHTRRLLRFRYTARGDRLF